MVRPAPNLTDQVIERLAEKITSGHMERGHALPSEQAMAEEFSVSRTVIREAISRLKAQGLVTSRQGRGVFVASNVRGFTFNIEQSLAASQEILDIVELRMAFEAEAAALAAVRRTDEQLEEMSRALAEMAEAISAGAVQTGVDADVRFHRAICIATGNPQYLAFLEFLSKVLHKSISVARSNSARKDEIRLHAQREHERIFAAISNRDPDAARHASRIHISNTAKRLSGGLSE